MLTRFSHNRILLFINRNFSNGFYDVKIEITSDDGKLYENRSLLFIVGVEDSKLCSSIKNI